MAAFVWVSIGTIVIMSLATLFAIKVTSRAVYIPDRANVGAPQLRRKVNHRVIVIMSLLTIVLIGMSAAILL